MVLWNAPDASGFGLRGFVLRVLGLADYRGVEHRFLFFGHRGLRPAAKESLDVEVRHHFRGHLPGGRPAGFRRHRGGAAGIAKVLFGLFLILAVIFIVLAALGVGAVKKALD